MLVSVKSTLLFCCCNAIFAGLIFPLFHLNNFNVHRDLVVSISYDEPGWQWSGSFLPDNLGDTQLKMRNFVSGTIHMVRVEVQNADISMGDEKIVGSIKGNSGTILILLSDDDTGYMPYRIDNFSKEVCPLLFLHHNTALRGTQRLLGFSVNSH